jgi:tetraacyldisaccharide 4'-kinase
MPEGNGRARIENSLLPWALRWSGPLLSAGYGLGVRIHRACSTPAASPLPTLCVGNMTVGGTGKTPAVKYIARELCRRGRKPAVLMRGYKEQASDEASEVERALKDLNVPVLLGSNRLQSAQRAKEQGCDVALLDDGFQHWRLARDLDIVLIDAMNPFGGGNLVPHGRLREPLAGLARAGVVVVTRSDMVGADDLAALKAKLKDLAPQASIALAQHEPVGLRDCGFERKTVPLEKLKSEPVYAVCGLGNPQAFLNTLKQLGANLRGNSCYPDHHDFDAWNLDFEILPAAQAVGATALVVTEKDAAKLEATLTAFTFPIWVLSVRFKLVEGEELLWQKIDAALSNARR